MTRPRDMGPADLAPNTAPPGTQTPQDAEIAERNAFFNSLPLAAQERFLDSLAAAQESGLDDRAAWAEAVRAVQATYPPEADEDVVLDDELDRDLDTLPPAP